MGSVSIRNLTRRTAPRLPFAEVAKTALPMWDLSLVFATPAKARALNQELRQKTYVPNVLSYALGTRSGEIIICLAEAKRQAPSYDLSTNDFVLFLFIHGCLHLKGYPHGSTMEKREQKLLVAFTKISPRTSLSTTHGTPHRNRNRHRNLSGQNSRRRGTRG